MGIHCKETVSCTVLGHVKEVVNEKLKRFFLESYDDGII